MSRSGAGQDGTHQAEAPADAMTAGEVYVSEVTAGEASVDRASSDEEVQSGLTDMIDAAFDLPERDWSQYAPLTLAYIGDAVFDLIVRTMLVKRADEQVEKLHRKASRIVNAATQAQMLQKIRPQLTAQEESVVRRGRNASPHHTAKNASREEYLEATALEALIGYLYLKRDYERLTELIRAGLREA